jgi:hypothetical protein
MFEGSLRFLFLNCYLGIGFLVFLQNIYFNQHCLTILELKASFSIEALHLGGVGQIWNLDFLHMKSFV